VVLCVDVALLLERIVELVLGERVLENMRVWLERLAVVGNKVLRIELDELHRAFGRELGSHRRSWLGVGLPAVVE
jgi:hypothetical protein